MMTFASVMPLLFSKKLRQDVDAVASERSNLRFENAALRDEVHRLRKYIDGQMREHFRAYNGGLGEQLKTMLELRLPTPWVPFGVRGMDDPTYDMPTCRTLTYFCEQRWVPAREAGRI